MEESSGVVEEGSNKMTAAPETPATSDTKQNTVSVSQSPSRSISSSQEVSEDLLTPPTPTAHKTEHDALDVESIGEADDLTSTKKKKKKKKNKEKRGKDEPDFWESVSQYSLRMKRDFRYFFQHPISRMFVAYFVTVCNFLIYAEDPVAHSQAESNIVVVGNIYSFVITKYPPGGWSVLKVFLWICALITGVLVGKLVIHRQLLRRICKIELFQRDRGSFMVMFITTLASLFAFSWLYNGFLYLGGEPLKPYLINGYMNFRNSSFMKAAACGTWLGDFVTAWMVTDVMLQEKFYPEWAPKVRVWWNTGKKRIIFFWVFAVVMSLTVVLIIATDAIQWDRFNAKLLATNELSRAFLASFILVMDLLILMQDWEFPHFLNHFDIKLPGLNVSDIKVQIPNCFEKLEEVREKLTIHITGKWFQYGVIFLVMILDLNMWKNQIFYQPVDYGQYADNNGYIHSLPKDDPYLSSNETYLSYDWRSNNTINGTNNTWASLDEMMEARFDGFHIGIKSIAFIPSLAGFILMTTLIIIYGRVKPTRSDPYTGRLQKFPKRKRLGILNIVRMKLHLKKVQDQPARPIPRTAKSVTVGYDISTVDGLDETTASSTNEENV